MRRTASSPSFFKRSDAKSSRPEGPPKRKDRRKNRGRKGGERRRGERRDHRSQRSRHNRKVAAAEPVQPPVPPPDSWGNALISFNIFPNWGEDIAEAEPKQLGVDSRDDREDKAFDKAERGRLSPSPKRSVPRKQKKVENAKGRQGQVVEDGRDQRPNEESGDASTVKKRKIPGAVPKILVLKDRIKKKSVKKDEPSVNDDDDNDRRFASFASWSWQSGDDDECSSQDKSYESEEDRYRKEVLSSSSDEEEYDTYSQSSSESEDSFPRHWGDDDSDCSSFESWGSSGSSGSSMVE